MRAIAIPANMISAEWFWSRTSRAESGCLEWTGAITRDGYGRVTHKRKDYYAHRVSLALTGMILDPGLVVDHLCRNHACVDPNHLEMVSPRVNTARGITHVGRCIAASDLGLCVNGHVLAEVGTHKQRDGRTCAECGRERVRRYKFKKGLVAA